MYYQIKRQKIKKYKEPEDHPPIEMTKRKSQRAESESERVLYTEY
jgi:hypothetical protein